jgi:hypothetical protein
MAQDQSPQPSFNDGAAIQYQRSSTASTPIVVQDFPKPSFNDFEPLPQHSVTGLATIEQHFPQGSFSGSGGPRGPAAVFVQPADSDAQHAIAPQPSFNG